MGMEPAWSTRIGWLDLPIHVRTAVEDILGSEVVQFVGQRGGFSPGTADRVLTSSGKRAFVKAVSRELNEDCPVSRHRWQFCMKTAVTLDVSRQR